MSSGGRLTGPDEHQPLLAAAGQQRSENHEDDSQSVASIVSTTTYIRQLLVRILEANPIANPARSHDSLLDDPGDQVCIASAGHDDSPQFIAASEVGASLRIAQLLIALILDVLASGIIFGYAAFKPVLIEDRVYARSCTQDESESGVSPCYYQNIRLDFAFATAAAITVISSISAGYLIAVFGPKLCSILGNVFLTLGALTLGIYRFLPIDGILLGFVLFALGGPMVYLPSFHLSNAFPKSSGAILAAITCTYEASSGVFLGLNMMSNSGLITLQNLFLVYAISLFFLLIAQILVMPSKLYQRRPGEDRHSDMEQASAAGTRCEDSGSRPDRVVKSSEQWGVMHRASPLQQALSPWFVLMALFAAIQSLHNNYLVASLSTQYQYLLPRNSDAKQVVGTFCALTPTAGAVAAVISDLLLDRLPMIMIMALTVFVPSPFGIFGCLSDSIVAAYGSVILFVLYRPFFHSAVSDYVIKVFGFTTFSKIIGLLAIACGLSNLLVVVLDILTGTVFEDSPIPVNAILTSASLLTGLMTFALVWRKTRPQRIINPVSDVHN